MKIYSCIIYIACLLVYLTASLCMAEDRPNILWLTCEDTGRHLGCYDFPTAETSNLDKLAERGMRYNHAWSNHPVCAPARTTIITGCYPASLGAEQMRSYVPLPDSIEMFPTYLRRAGYYCTNNFKEDYNVFSKHGKSCWNASGRKAHWKKRPDHSPFFAVFNFTITHESRIRDKHLLKRDPDKTPVPKYHPNVPEVRRDWSQYHDRITEMDALCAEKLDELKKAGLDEDTIVFFFGDHGSGMPGNKRTPLDRGLGVPMIVHFPEKYRHLAPAEYQSGTFDDRLVSFVDLAPTVLSLAGIKPPSYMQGIPFAGKFEGEKRQYSYGFKGRMDERGDLVRSITDGKHVYVRNYHPEVAHGLRYDYMFQTPTARAWRRLYEEGKLLPEQASFWQRKMTEELYDLEHDPDETNNLIQSPRYAAVVSRLRQALYDHTLEIHDIHFLPESMLHECSSSSTPYEIGQDSQKYPLEKILKAANISTDRSAPIADWEPLLSDDTPAVRYWAAIGLLMRLADTAGPEGTSPGEETAKLHLSWKPFLNKLIADDEAAVRIVAAESMGRFGSDEDVRIAFETLVPLTRSPSSYTCWQTLEALDSFASRCEREDVETVLAMDFSRYKGRPGALFPFLIKSIRQQILSEKIGEEP